MIYFIRCGEFVKIGFTESKYMDTRLGAIRSIVPYPVSLMLCVDGTELDENNMQWSFVEYHYRNEWFRLEGKLADFIESKSVDFDHSKYFSRTRINRGHKLPRKTFKMRMLLQRLAREREART